MKVKIIGAGSIGNHMAHASRSLDWQVDMCDIDPLALERAKYQIYPTRYGEWDQSIQLFNMDDAPTSCYDLIIIGTPPDTHVKLALEMIEEKPKGILVEKPFCTPELVALETILAKASKVSTQLFVGYDHVLGAAAVEFCNVLKSGVLGDLETLDVEFREHWGGIFAAHPWLDGPFDSYLGYSRRGGGASGEHSHAINLWQHFALAMGAGKVVDVQASMSFVDDGVVEYDKLCLLNLKTESGLLGRVVQDVVTKPSRKWARAQGSSGYVEWHCNFKNGADKIVYSGEDNEAVEKVFEKTRPDDFIAELKHIQSAIGGQLAQSDITVARGLETMLVIAAAHKSAANRRSVQIDYSRGFNSQAVL